MFQVGGLISCTRIASQNHHVAGTRFTTHLCTAEEVILKRQQQKKTPKISKPTRAERSPSESDRAVVDGETLGVADVQKRYFPEPSGPADA